MPREIVLNNLNHNTIYILVFVGACVISYIFSFSFIYSLYTKEESSNTDRLFDTVLINTFVAPVLYGISYKIFHLTSISIVASLIAAFLVTYLLSRKTVLSFFDMYRYMLIIFQAVILSVLIVCAIFGLISVLLILPMGALFMASIAVETVRYKRACVITLSILVWGIYLLLDYYINKSTFRSLNLLSFFVILIGITSTLYVILFHRENYTKFIKDKLKKGEL